MTVKSGWTGERAWLLWVLATLVAVGGCATTPTRTADRPAATVTASEHADDASDTDPVGQDAQVVEIAKYDLAFEIPAGWMSLDARNLLDPSNPAVKELADRMGASPEQFVEGLGKAVLTFSITDEGAVDGFVDNVNSVEVPQADFNDDQLKLDLASMGAKPEEPEHVSTPAGEITRVPYTVEIQGMTVHGVALVLDAGEAATSITVSSHSPVKAEELADQIVASLRPTD